MVPPCQDYGMAQQDSEQSPYPEVAWLNSAVMGSTSGLSGCYSFVAANTQYLYSNDQVVSTDDSYTICAWFKTDSTTLFQTLYYECQYGVDSQNYLNLSLSTTSSFVDFRKRTSGASIAALSDTSWKTAGVWQHACGVSDNVQPYRAYLNANPGADQTTDVNPSPDFMSIGASYDGLNPDGFFSGKIAHVAVWNVALTQENITALAVPGTLPTSISGCIAYWPLTTNLNDTVGTKHLTGGGGTGVPTLDSTDGPW